MTKSPKGKRPDWVNCQKVTRIDGISWVSTRTITDAWRIDKENKVETGICINQWSEYENLADTKLDRLCPFPKTLSFRRHFIL
jgi:hypothetical protein